MSKIGEVYVEIKTKSDQLKTDLQAIPKQATSTAQQIESSFNKINLSKTTKDLDNVTGGVKNFNMVGMNFNRIVQDSPYFLSSFNMGIMSIGNNIGPLAESFQAARARGESLKTMMAGMFTGMGGWITAINLAVAAVTAFALANRSAKEEMDGWDLKSLIGELDNYAKSLNKVKKELSELSDVDLGKVLGNLNKRLAEELRKIVLSLQAASVGGPAGGLLQMIFGRPEDYTEALIKLNSAIKAADDEIVNRTSNPESVNFIKKRIDELTEEFNKGNTALAPQINKLKAQLESIEDLINPKKSNAKTEFGVLAPLQKKLKDLEALKPLANTVEAAADLQLAINAVNRELEDLQAKINVLGRDTSFDKITGKDVTKIPRDKDSMSLINMKGMEDPWDNLMQKIDKDLADADRKAGAFADTISSGFVNGISSGQTFGQVLTNITTQLAEMVAQAFLFEAIFALINPTGKSGGLFEGLFSRVSVPTSSIPVSFAPSTAETISTRFASNSPSASLGEPMNKTIISNKIYLDKKLIAQSINEAQDELSRGNVRNRR